MCLREAHEANPCFSMSISLLAFPTSLPLCRGGEKLRSAIFRNFPQFSAIFPQFFTLPDFLTASPRWCRTMRIFVFYYSIHSQMLQSPQNLA